MEKNFYTKAAKIAKPTLSVINRNVVCTGQHSFIARYFALFAIFV
jgi:hypothetical protein